MLGEFMTVAHLELQLIEQQFPGDREFLGDQLLGIILFCNTRINLCVYMCMHIIVTYYTTLHTVCLNSCTYVYFFYLDFSG